MHWLDQYRSHVHDWHACEDDANNTQCFYRRLGVVETTFDHDGTDLEGRADINCMLTTEIRSSLDRPQFRDRVKLAWACMRQYHVLMSATAVYGTSLPLKAGDAENGERYFLLRCRSPKQALQDANNTLTWVEDHYRHVDPSELYRHVMNTARTVDITKACAEMFVLPLQASSDGKHHLRFLNVAAHQITDGYSSYTTHLYFVSLLNRSEAELKAMLQTLVKSENVWSRLPPAQESIYPPIPGSRAQQRWFWAISRIFRHKRRRPPPAFANPLRRSQPLAEAQAMEPKFDRLFDYTRKPPLNTFVESAVVPTAATRRIQRLCRSVGVSIGAGCFTLCALAMMELQEELYPSNEQPHFIGSFPLNPRPFLAKDAPTLPSIMLAFSDGLHLPFLPSDLSLEGRFRLLARQANRQLRIYQKGTRASQNQPLGLHHPTQLLPSNYIALVERVESKLPPHRRKGLNPQGDYPATTGAGATCGVSSIGARSQFIKGAQYDLDDDSKDLAVDFRDLGPSVRARDGECLVGSAGDDDGLFFSVSYDANALDERLVRRWRELMETMFEPDTRSSRL
ncbi:MAG: hypothetical protein M1828_006707 [Chrysothrix sp. TS-e1954]|nr:MAG: hypothetical protein M1828_006707 [Chrysothrix sp. TS-e1954]